jgi:hypothetical protein
VLDPSWNVNGFPIEKENAFRNRIKAGAWCLLASGVLTFAGLLLRGPIIDPSTQARAFATVTASSQHVWAWSLLLPSLVIQLYGFLGLYTFLADTPQHRWALAGAVLSVAGNGLFLPFAGIIAFVTPAVARLYLDGNPAVIHIAAEGLAGTFATPFMMASALFLLLGSIFFGIAIWRSRRLPKGAAIPYVVHSLLIGFVAPHSYALELTGGVLLLWSTAWIAGTIWQAVGSVQPGS